MPNHIDYFNHIHDLLNNLLEKEKENLEKAVEYLFEATKTKNNIFVFGASHAGIITEELTYRAGGLATMNPIFEPSMMLNTIPITQTSKMERLEGYGRLIAEKTPFKKNDVLIAHSVSGRNTVMIDLVQAAKEKGVNIIAITNLTYSKNVDSRHSSGKNLYQLADLVIDNHGDKGDAAIKFESLSQKVGPTSTVIGATLVNAIVVALTDKLINAGIDAPILHSANMDGGDQYNQKIFKKFNDNIFYL